MFQEVQDDANERVLRTRLQCSCEQRHFDDVGLSAEVKEAYQSLVFLAEARPIYC